MPTSPHDNAYIFVSFDGHPVERVVFPGDIEDLDLDDRADSVRDAYPDCRIVVSRGTKIRATFDPIP